MGVYVDYDSRKGANMKRSTIRHEVLQQATPEGYTELVYADRPRNLTEMLDNTVGKYGNREGLITTSERLTYEQFASAVNRVSSALYYEYGIRKGDRVALMLSNGLEFAIAFFSVVKLGAIGVPINTAFKGGELAYQVKDSGATVLFVESEFHELIAGVRSEIGCVKYIFVTDDQPLEGTLAFSQLLEQSEYVPVHTKVNETDGAVLMYTSGTTGRPKGALLLHKGMVAAAIDVDEWFNWRVGDKMLLTVPLFHVTALAMILCSSIYAGVPLVLMKKFKAADALRVVQEERITAMIIVPTIIWLMLNAPEFDQYDLSSLRMVAAGGAASTEALLRLCADKLPGVELVPGYGLTEATGVTHTTTTLREALTKLSSVGHPVPVVEAKIVDASGRELPSGESGELLLKSCQIFREYWNNPEATRDTIVDGWLHTGDLAKVTEDGYTYILDRMKDMIIRGGENIYSIEIENVSLQNPKVLEAAIVGVPDSVFGEQVKAVLVLKPGEQATAEEMQEFYGKYLARYKIPKYIEFRESLPRNPAGKVTKQQLK
jgi:long-chain acyl-CoA synthetase